MTISPRIPDSFDPRLFLRDSELDYGIQLIFRAESVLATAIHQLARDHDVSVAMARALMTIRFEPGISVSHLRKRSGAYIPTFARLLAALAQKELIERRKAPDDARERLLFLSEAGLSLTQSAAEHMRSDVKAAYRSAGADAVGAIRKVLGKLA